MTNNKEFYGCFACGEYSFNPSTKVCPMCHADGSIYKYGDECAMPGCSNSSMGYELNSKWLCSSHGNNFQENQERLYANELKLSTELQILKNDQVVKEQQIQQQLSTIASLQQQINNTEQARQQAERKLNDIKIRLNLDQIEELNNLPQLPQGETVNQIWEEVQNFRQRNQEEQIRNQRERLEQLRTNARNRLNNNLHFILDELLEIQKAFARNDNSPFAQSQLERFKTRLLNSEQITEQEINNLCEAQRELTRLEIIANIQEHQTLIRQN